jgi:CelD/BcsL family acetyltransferase involved in cellulose biosynthesis
MIDMCSDLGSLASDWDELALQAGSPFLTQAWLSCWWSSFGKGEPLWIVLHESDGSLRAGAFLHREGRRMESCANVHSGDWNGLARDEKARAELWAAVARQKVNRIRLQALPADEPATGSARQQLERAGYRVVFVPGPFAPHLTLPRSWDELMRMVSGGLRQQVGRRRRALDREGALVYRTVTGGPTLAQDLDAFLKLEASGWKGEAGTAILCGPATERLYRGFADAAARHGWLRLHLLELDGVLIAGSYDCAFAGAGYLLKTSFSEAHARFTPGLVLLAEVLRSSIEEGLGCYEFLGEADRYKTRWTSQRRPRAQLWAYRGIARPGHLYPRALRPLLKSARDKIKPAGPAGRRGG